MSKQVYQMPSAELIYLAPQEELSASWFWGVFKTETSSAKTIENKDVWNPFDFTQSKDSYTWDNKPD